MLYIFIIYNEIIYNGSPPPENINKLLQILKITTQNIKLWVKEKGL